MYIIIYNCTSVLNENSFLFQHLTSVDQNGPYRIAGYSFGAVVALEMANQLMKNFPDRSDIVQSLTLLDGSHRFVEMYTSVYRKAMKLSTLSEEQAASLCAFVRLFIKFDETPVSIYYTVSFYFFFVLSNALNVLKHLAKEMYTFYKIRYSNKCLPPKTLMKEYKLLLTF